MKKSLFSMILVLPVVFGFAQNDHKPPKQVSESFQREYPQSKPSKWSHSNEGWSVSFQDNDHNNGEATAYFDGSGKHLDTHIPYDQKDVPASVRNHTRDSYGASDQYDYTRIDRSGEKAVYKTQVKHKKHDKTIYMDNNGHERDYQDKHY
ncbi:MAG TPA: hypothetical protein VGI38_13010 [Puia sp.]